MSLLFETILIKEALPVNLRYHKARFNNARKHFWNEEPISLLDFIPLSGLDKNTLYRCRIDYEKDIHSVTVNSYTARKITTLKMITADDLDYQFKYCDRRSIDELFQKRESADDILIIKKNLVTDTSIGNIVFNRKGKYYTPAVPLLKGTQRSFLLDTGIIEEREIKIGDIYTFDGWQFINALNPFNDSRFNPAENIIL